MDVCPWWCIPANVYLSVCWSVKETLTNVILVKSRTPDVKKVYVCQLGGSNNAVLHNLLAHHFDKRVSEDLLWIDCFYNSHHQHTFKHTGVWLLRNLVITVHCKRSAWRRPPTWSDWLCFLCCFVQSTTSMNPSYNVSWPFSELFMYLTCLAKLDCCTWLWAMWVFFLSHHWPMIWGHASRPLSFLWRLSVGQSSARCLCSAVLGAAMQPDCVRQNLFGAKVL